MFYVINKSKIYSYLVALCTVVVLFVAATTINDMASSSQNLVETGTNVVYRNEIDDIQNNDRHENQFVNSTNHIK